MKKGKLSQPLPRSYDLMVSFNVINFLGFFCLFVYFSPL